MEVIKAPLRDVWPDPNNPRRDFGDIDALAETFAINPERPGEPLNPPVVVRHGHAARTGEPMYRLVDGERRFRAMRRLHDDAYEASFVLCDGLDEADRAVAMLATDDKARLTDEERSRGVQRMLVLDVPYEKVEKAARLPRGAAAKAKLGAALAGEAAGQMSLERLMAMCEFEGDPDALAELRACGEGGFAAALGALRRARERRELSEALRAACAAAGIGLSEGDPDYGAVRFAGLADDPEAVAGAAAQLPEGFQAFLRDGGGPHVAFYAPDGRGAGDRPDPEEEAAREREGELAQAVSAAQASRAAWLVERVAAGAALPNTAALMAGLLFDGELGWAARERLTAAEGFGFDMGSLPTGAATGSVLAWMVAEGDARLGGVAGAVARGERQEWARDLARRYLRQDAAMCADGYDGGDADGLVARALLEYLGLFDGEGGGGSE